jgi:hypothetical protein
MRPGGCTRSVYGDEAVRELSLHILDLLENSVRAGASRIDITVAQSRAENALEIVIEDDGSGFALDPEHALDPFYTTKPGKHTGLGLSLFATAVEQAGGVLSVVNRTEALGRPGGANGGSNGASGANGSKRPEELRASQGQGGSPAAKTVRGAILRARLQLDHIDRLPLGDLAATLSVISCTHPDLEIACTLRAEGREQHVQRSEVEASAPATERNPIGVAMRLAASVRQATRELGVTA